MNSKFQSVQKNDQVNIDSLKSINRGNRSIYIIKDGYYKNSYYDDGNFTYSYTYDNITKRMYDQDAKRDFLTFRDSRKANVGPSESKIYKDSIREFLGEKCFLVVYKNENSITQTYYPNNIKINPENFENHKVGNWYDKIKEVGGSIGLKTITEYEDYILTYEAIKVERRDVNQNEFSLPENLPVVASYSTLDSNVELVQPNQNQLDCYFEKIKNAVSENSISEPFTTYIELIVSKEGQISHLKPLEKDTYGFHQVAMDIIQSCDIQFKPGKIDNSPVSSLTYFPIIFE